MKTYTRDEAAPIWQKYWDEMQKEWFKVEVLQDYSAEDNGPSLQAWQSGDKTKSIELLKSTDTNEWIKACQSKVNNGISLIRIHIVDEPYSKYLEWEMEAYKYINKPLCGEKINIIPRSKINDLDIPKGDFMIFDNKRVVVNNYSDNGLMTHQTFYDETDDISLFLELRESLLNISSKTH